ncbi:MAG: hypothetical protein V1929_03280 [bacterium]
MAVVVATVRGVCGAGTNEAVLAAVEARLAVTALVEQNAKLRADVDELGGQVKDLTVTLAETVAELDVARAAAGKAVGRSLATADGAGIAVVDVNRPLGMVVLAAGESAGVKLGMQFAVMRDRRLVARVRASDVREAIAGAVVEELAKDDFPVKGDRAIVWREKSDE